MTQEEIAPQFISHSVEPTIRAFWETKNIFHADPHSLKPGYAIVMPPPNVTGVLHMGHALVNTLQDILIRWKKMTGYEVLWVPGTDHAGIATQTVVERHLMQTEGKRRTEYDREEFLKKVWDWKDKSQEIILNQIKMLGCGCDWSRLSFSMDTSRNKAVREMFKILFDKGLIYRGDYLINWDPVSGTALADDEVEYEERQGNLYTIRYPLKDSDLSLFVATTRPETLLGDTAVAVHPKDPRYAAYIGKYIDHPITKRSIPIIADDFVDPEFGTGVVKVTPGHDPNDYQLAIRHKLPMINILNPNGTLNEQALSYHGMSVDVARQKIVEDLKKIDLLTKIEPHTHRVGISYRSKAVIEPMLSKQWFVALSQFKEILRHDVETDKVRLVPKSWQTTYFQWIDNLRDWCISRQLWWGHRIPVWYNKKDRNVVIVYSGDDLPEEVQTHPEEWEQDSDVLDTWFSSALWPFSTLGWPEKTADLEKFYPNATLITGHDILFFWVARMIMMGEVGMQAPPFKETFLHGLIYGKSYWRQDARSGGITYVSQEEKKAFDLDLQEVPKDVNSRWEKMSKSKGNVIDPMEVIEEYGTDAMRLALASSATDARQIDLDRRRFAEWKNFANKVWNGARFVLMNIQPEETELLFNNETIPLRLEDRWIIARVQQVAMDVETALEKYAFDKASQEAYDFYWNEFCAYYVEMSKPALFGKRGLDEKQRKQKIALLVLYDAIRILHPFAPFITEELFQMLQRRYSSWIPHRKKVLDPKLGQFLDDLLCDSIVQTSYPKQDSALSTESIEQFGAIQEVIATIRSIRGAMKLAPSQLIKLYVYTKNRSTLHELIAEMSGTLEALLRLESITLTSDSLSFAVESRAMVGDIELIVPLPDEMKAEEITRLEKEINALELLMAKTEGQLANEAFVQRAPAHVVEKIRMTLEQQKAEKALMQSQRTRLL